MRVLVCGASGCVGGAIVRALRSRGHAVVEAARGLPDGPGSLGIDYAWARAPAWWADRLRALRIDVVVNAVGILMPAGGASFERVHTAGPIELFRGAVLAGVRRVVQVSALGVDGSPASLATPYLHSKLLADDALAGLPLDWVVLRPSLLFGPGSQSAALFATLASLPLVALPGRGDQALQPLHVYELAEAAARLVEARGTLRVVHELGGGEVMTYRAMLSRYRQAMGLGEPLWLPLPLAWMRLAAAVAEGLPQRVFCRDTVNLLAHGSVPAANATEALLGRVPSGLAHGLAITPPVPLVDLRVVLSPPVALALRVSLAFMWLYTAAISAVWPEQSGVLQLLARCGFSGPDGLAALVASCLLNTTLGLLILWRPSAPVYALQTAAILGYTLTAAVNMPELTLDHCGPLVKNLPVLMAVMVLWLAHGRPVDSPAPAVRRHPVAPSALNLRAPAAPGSR